MSKIIVVCLWVLAAAGIQVLATDNPVINADFENGKTGWLGRNWEISDTEKHGGKHSLHLKMDDVKAKAICAQTVEVDAQKPAPLIIGCWVKGKTLKTNSQLNLNKPADRLKKSRIHFSFHFQDGTQDNPTQILDNYEEWTYLEKKYNPKKPVKYIVIYLKIENAKDEYFFDDFYFWTKKNAEDRQQKQLPSQPKTKKQNIGDNNKIDLKNGGKKFILRSKK